jgi:hypothetical protein
VSVHPHEVYLSSCKKNVFRVGFVVQRYMHLDEITLVVISFFSEDIDTTRRPGSSELSSRFFSMFS